MSYLRDRVFVLKKEPFREQDRRYTMYGREHGLIVAVARGTSLKTSKHAGHLEPFSEVEIMVAEGKVFDQLAVATSVDGALSQRLSEHLAGLAILGAFCNLVIRLTRPGVSDERIFDLLIELRHVCAELPAEPSSERSRLLLAGATLKFLDQIGLGPQISHADLDIPKQAITLLQFLRRFPLADALRITAPVDILVATSSFIEDALRHTPLERAPHGPSTIHAMLT